MLSHIIVEFKSQQQLFTIGKKFHCALVTISLKKYGRGALTAPRPIFLILFRLRPDRVQNTIPNVYQVVGNTFQSSHRRRIIRAKLDMALPIRKTGKVVEME